MAAIIAAKSHNPAHHFLPMKWLLPGFCYCLLVFAAGNHATSNKIQCNSFKFQKEVGDGELAMVNKPSKQGQLLKLKADNTYCFSFTIHH